VKDSPAQNSKTDPAERAAREALRLLGRRPLTEDELRRRLEDRGHAADAVASALQRAVDAGYVDDSRLAGEYIATRARRLGHGKDRLLRELRRRGVDADLAASAWDRVVEEEGLEPLKLLRRAAQGRVERCGGKLDPRAYRRVYNALLRAGFDPDAIAAELRAYRIFPDSDDS